MGGWFLSVRVGLRAPLAWASSTTGVLHIAMMMMIMMMIMMMSYDDDDDDEL